MPVTSSNNDSKGRTFKFQAEIQRVLDILINRLYKNREIFLRELISNSADALHRMRISQLETKDPILDPDIELGIKISFDEDENTLIISDTGIGMTYQEIKTNLGTIAQSGTLEFLKQLEDSPDAVNLIGQFGVGFYSSFIVAKEVIVRSCSYPEGSRGVEWRSDGSGKFSVAYIDKPERGTDVILYLKDDAKEFANKFKIESIVKKYSDFVGFPIRIADDDQVVNRQIPIWHQSEDEVTNEEYNEFYRQASLDWTEPFHRIQLNVDAPIQFRALLFLPKQRNRMMMTSQYQDYGLRLYSKKILVQEKAKDLLPEYLRFVVGVVDSEDLPLNVSREVIQVDRTIRRISKVITGKILDELEKVAEEDEDKYLEWWGQFGGLIKEGITQDEKRRKKLLNILRVRTSKSEDQLITLAKYVECMPDEQEEIFYLLGEKAQTLKRSPHLEYYQKLDQEVILFAEPIDSFVVMHVTEFQDKKFKPIDQAEPEPPKDEDKEGEEAVKDKEEESEKDSFLTHLKDMLGDRIIDIRYTDFLTDSPCRLVNPSGTAAFSRVLKYMDENYVPQKKIMEINADHSLIKRLKNLVEEEPDSPLIQICSLQLLENQELSEGILQDPTEMIKRINQLMQQTLDKKLSSNG
ncbi:MAG: molecular chaperone HtpG [Candidatus Hodarchaeales archaeon]|jgi:molecular chaperone HtpG